MDDLSRWRYLSFVGLAVLSACSPPELIGQKKAVEPSSHAILNGTEVSADDEIARSTLLFLSNRRDLNGNLLGGDGTLCTATILSPTLAVTAAHCIVGSTEKRLAPVRAEDVRLYFGNYLNLSDLSKNPPNFRSLVRKTSGVISLAKFRELPSTPDKSEVHDEALIFFDGGLPDGKLPARILKSDVTFQASDRFTVAGYGSTGQASDGSHTLRSFSSLSFSQYINPSVVELASTRVGGVAPGDSGGPAFLIRDGHPYFWGVSSFSDGGSAQWMEDIRKNADAIHQAAELGGENFSLNRRN